MALRIIVDGYNLIGSRAGLRGKLDSQRQQLLEQLQEYHQKKGYPITVVFDGWRSGWIYEVEERSGGITVIYSQRGEKADSVIERLAREIGEGCVVVSSDREVRKAVEAHGAVAIYASEFIDKLRELNGDEESQSSRGEGLTGLREGKRGNPRRFSRAERKRRGRLRKL